MENRRVSSKEEDPEMQKLIVELPVTNKGTTSPTSTAAAMNTGSSGKAITSCIMYSFCSVSMVLVNKSLASRYVIYYLSRELLDFLIIILIKVSPFFPATVTII